jgi:hypothetical protein
VLRGGGGASQQGAAPPAAPRCGQQMQQHHRRRIANLGHQLLGRRYHGASSPAPPASTAYGVAMNSPPPPPPSSLCLPPLLTFEQGGQVDSSASWRERRRELERLIVPHEFGGLPPKHKHVTVHNLSSSTFSWHKHSPTKSVRYCRYEIRTEFDGGRQISTHLDLWMPPNDGDRALPVLLDIDGCWRYFDDKIIEGVLGRGNIAASIDRK